MNGPLTVEALRATVATVAWTGTVYKVRHLWRRPADIGLRWFCGTLFVLALALTVLWGPAYGGLDRLLGYPNLAIVVGDALALAACCGALCYLAHLAYPDSRAIRLASVFVLAWCVTVGAMMLFFSRIPTLASTSQFWEVYGPVEPGVAALRLSFLPYLAVSCIGFVRLATNYERAAARRSTMAGMQLVKVGALVGLVFVANEAARVLTSSPTRTVSPAALGVSCVSLILIGVLLPSVGPRLRVEQVLERIANDSALRRVNALWAAMTRSRPQVVFEAGASDAVSRLYRNVVEIQDAAVRMEAPQALVTSLTREAESVAEKNRAAFIAAGSLALALRYPAEGDTPISFPSGRADLNDEARSIVQVARWWNSRQLRGALARVTGVLPSRLYRLAQLVSEVVAPMPVIGALAVVIALHSSPRLGDGVRWAAVAALFVAVLPFAYILLRTRRGAVTDHHIRRRSQRTGPMLVTGLSILAGLAVMLLGGAPRQLVALIVVGLAGLLATGIITQFWKISLHTSTLAGAVMCAVLIFGAPAWPLFLLPLAVAWARLELGEHTVLQVAIGILTGAEVAAVVFPPIA